MLTKALLTYAYVALFNSLGKLNLNKYLSTTLLNIILQQMANKKFIYHKNNLLPSKLKTVNVGKKRGL